MGTIMKITIPGLDEGRNRGWEYEDTLLRFIHRVCPHVWGPRDRVRQPDYR